MNTNCSNCGQSIKNVIIIDRKPYGLTCAERKLGFKLPPWFTGGDWNRAKETRDKLDEAQRQLNDRNLNKSREFWPELIMLSRLSYISRMRCDDWATNFISSVARQAGYHNLVCEFKYADTYDNYVSYRPNEYHTGHDGLFSSSIMDYESNGIAQLSPKQLALIEKLRNKYKV